MPDATPEGEAAGLRRRIVLPAGTLTVEAETGAWTLDALCGFASRDNPRRAFLFVSRVLGRHLPAGAQAMRATYRALAERIPADLPGPVAVVGLAETAVALGTGVFAEWLARTRRDDAVFLHTTRYALDHPRIVGFVEEHSHAADHILYRPADPAAAGRLSAARTLLLVDDEMTTGRTFANLQAALAAACPHVQTVLGVVLTDWRADGAGGPPAVSLLRGTYRFQPNPDFTPGTPPRVVGDGAVKPFLTRNDGRLGLTGPPRLDPGWVARARALGIRAGDRVLVLGTGEFVYVPFLLAEALERALGADAVCQATTRSPVLPGNAIGHTRRFPDNYGDGIVNFLYNVPGGSYDHVLLCCETPAPPPDLAEALGATVLRMGAAP